VNRVKITSGLIGKLSGSGNRLRAALTWGRTGSVRLFDSPGPLYYASATGAAVKALLGRRRRRLIREPGDLPSPLIARSGGAHRQRRPLRAGFRASPLSGCLRPHVGDARWEP
jgi:hypothetical protein